MQRPRGATARLEELKQARREEQFLPSLEARERDPPYVVAHAAILEREGVAAVRCAISKGGLEHENDLVPCRVVVCE